MKSRYISDVTLDPLDMPSLSLKSQLQRDMDRNGLTNHNDPLPIDISLSAAKIGPIKRGL
jgi:hypothetical protein